MCLVVVDVDGDLCINQNPVASPEESKLLNSICEGSALKMTYKITF